MSDSSATVAARIARLLDDNPPIASLSLAVLDCGIRVHSNQPAVIDALARYYHDFTRDDVTIDTVVYMLEADPPEIDVPLKVAPPAPGKTRIKDETADLPDGRILRKRITGMVFLFGGADNLAIGPCLENLNQVVNFINNRFLLPKHRNI